MAPLTYSVNAATSPLPTPFPGKRRARDVASTFSEPRVTDPEDRKASAEEDFAALLAERGAACVLPSRPDRRSPKRSGEVRRAASALSGDQDRGGRTEPRGVAPPAP